jgi:polysaccharide pyruvyl transferase WcaK-like protein
MKRIALLNAYDIRNRGDLAIVLCQREWLQRRYPQAGFTVFSRYHEANRRLFGADSVRSVIGTQPGTSPLTQIVDMGRDHWNAVQQRSRTANDRLRAFYEADLYALTGGGYFYSSRAPLLSRNLIQVCQTFLLAGDTGKPVLQFPQSFGPFSKRLDVAYVKRVCRQLPRLVPRDEESRQILAAWGFGGKAEVVPDIVFLMRRLLPDHFRETAARRGLGIAPVECGFAQAFGPADRETYLEKLAQAAEFFHRQTGEAVVLFSQVYLEGNDDDSPAVRDLESKLARRGIPVSVVAGHTELRDYLGEFQKLRLCIGSRMHACIFAFVSGTPVAGLAYQPKFFGSFEAMGRPAWVQPIKFWSVAWATQWLNEVLSGGEALRRDLAGSLSKLEIQIDVAMERALKLTLQAALNPTG